MASIFHKFIEVSAEKPSETNNFSQFAYMEHDIRKSYKQVKDNKGAQKPNEDFVDYWKEIGKQGREEQVGIYFRWIELLERAIKNTPLRQYQDRENNLYIKKSLIGKWQTRRVKLSGLTLFVFSKNLREYPLRCFGIRKSKNKQHFSLVLEVIMQAESSKYKSFHVGTNNIIEYQEWYQDLQARIDSARIQFFKDNLQLKNNQESKFISIHEDKILPNISTVSQGRGKMKTITELVIDKELKQIEEFDELQVIEQSQLHQVRQEQVHPNIFAKLFPQRNLQTFADSQSNNTLLQLQNQYRLYSVEGKVKIFLTISHSISMVFRAISESHKYWNPDIDVFTVKNKISSENSVLIYQKDKSRGFLYRERDYLFLRHCFSIENLEGRHRIFMVQKSIDSIHTPPFMSVARGQKDLVWELIGKPNEKQCLLIVQGLIKGGGYMNAAQNIEMTIKHHKKLTQLETYIKQIEYSKASEDSFLFRQLWYVNLKPEEQQFYSPRQMNSMDFGECNVRKNVEPIIEIKEQQQVKKEEQFKQFIKHTSIENFDQIHHDQKQLNMNISIENFSMEYTPPQFASDKTVIIPQQYLKVHHRLEPKMKGKQILGQKIRGHHLWKGQWCVSEAGGLQYIDQDKMRQQKKVLTFIIKRIGKNILSGKGVLNISLPVDIFCRESNIERLALSFGYFPRFLEPIINAKDPISQLKGILASSFGSSLIYLTMQKPFNPILGQTYQAWVDGCPVYFQQISHHPPVAAYLMKGRGFELSGSVQAKMDLSINSGTGINEGIFTVKFDNGRTFHFTTPPGQLSGLTYGQRKLCFVDKTYFWSIQDGLFLQMTYNPLSKQRGFFGGGGKNLVGEERLADYFDGILRKYKPEDLREFFTPKKNDTRKLMNIPKGSPPFEVISDLGKVWGRWTKYVHFGEQRLFQADKDQYFAGFDEKYPLPSHSNYREDVVYRRMNNYILSQEFKQVLEVKQRKDRKLRQEYRKKQR